MNKERLEEIRTHVTGTGMEDIAFELIGYVELNQEALANAETEVAELKERIDLLLKASDIVEREAKSLTVANLYNAQQRVDALEQALDQQRQIARREIAHG